MTVFFLSLVISVNSQDLEVGFTAGGCYYLGDLNPGKHFLNTQVSYGLVARLNLDTRWSVKISGTRGKIMGSAASSTFLPDRGLSFTSDLTDISGVVEFNFLPYFTGSRMNVISPYIYSGISVFFFNPVNNGISLRTLGTEGQNIGYEGRKPYGSVGVSIPFGLGVKVSLAKRVGMQVYWEMHKTYNDYLDDVSTTYYLDGRTLAKDDQTGVASDPTLNHEPGMQRGNSSNNDWYAFFGVAFTYKFNLLSSKKCRDLKH
ncbi:MAG: DUF6089 family protein [Bacteroidetes bacterium]|nr:DUF6089 family protein [Bacteroidota bacterium]